MIPRLHQAHSTSENHCAPLRWSKLLFELSVEDILILEQLYLVHGSPRSLADLQRALAHLNIHPRTVARHCRRLEKIGLLNTISSIDLLINPVVALEPNVQRLVRLWQIREDRARRGRSQSRN